MERIAIFGGTFDPVHWGHLMIAETALSQLELERVIWVPVHRPPHKRGRCYEHRRLMVEIAIAEKPAFVLDPRKANHTEPDYAIDTLADLQNTYPNRQWFWIVGLDAFQTLPRWYCRERLVPACDWLVAPRPLAMTSTNAVVSTHTSHSLGIDPPDRWLCQEVAEQLSSQDIPIRWQMLHMPPMSISSSLIRQYSGQGHSLCEWVPEGVQAYITTHNLYVEN